MAGYDPNTEYTIRYNGVVRVVNGDVLNWLVQQPEGVEVTFDGGTTWLDAAVVSEDLAQNLTVGTETGANFDGTADLLTFPDLLDHGAAQATETLSRLDLEFDLRQAWILARRAAQAEDPRAAALHEEWRSLKEEYNKRLMAGDPFV